MNLKELMKEFGPKPEDKNVEIDLESDNECDPCKMYRDSSEGRSRGVLDRWKDPFEKEQALVASVIAPMQGSGMLTGGVRSMTRIGDIIRAKDPIRAITRPDNVDEWETDIPLRAGNKLIVVVDEQGLAQYMVKMPNGHLCQPSEVNKMKGKDAHLGGVRE